MPRTSRQLVRFIVLALGAAVTGAAVYYGSGDFTRSALLRKDTDRLQAIGQRLIVGYKNFSEIRDLVAHKAVTGVYVTARNVKGKSHTAIAAEIAELQAIRSAQGMPKLIIAADQEGGLVSHLSPPLTALPSLASILAPLTTEAQRRAAVEEFARHQAQDLRSLGITMNLAPVVDLRPQAPLRDDEASHIYLRAISDDPQMVAQVASWYCSALSGGGVACVLKHFPGLGRVMEDTHAAAGEIRTSEDELERSDWIAFRHITKLPQAALMVGHVRLEAIDSTRLASHSSAVMDGLLRRKWSYSGLIITDDLGMGAITDSSPGIEGAAVAALNAGADLLLIANGRRHLNAVLSALLEADERGEVDKAKEAASRKRLADWHRHLDGRP